MLRRNPFDEHVGARLLDFYGVQTRWPRRLWSIGAVLALEEILEASKARREDVLSPETVRFIANDAQTLLGRDPAVGSTAQRRSIGESLNEDLTFEGFAYRKLQTLIPSVKANYLRRVAALVAADNGDRPTPERTARMIATHLLDLGFSPRYLYRWWDFRLRKEETGRTLAELLDDAARLSERSAQRQRVLVAFRAAPDVAAKAAPGWMHARHISSWLRERGLDPRGLRQHGGVLLDVEALDPEGAVDAAAEQVDRIAARIAIGTRGRRLIPHEKVWVDGYPKPIPLHEPRRVEVRALEREDKLFVRDGPSAVDAALELLGPLDEGPVGPAVAGGWAATESLLSMPGDRQGKVAAADRLAALVACSWPRAELTTLAYRYAAGADSDSDLGERIRCAVDNRERAKTLADSQLESAISFSHPSDFAAWARMRDIFQSPRDRLRDVEQHARSAIRRLYRQRNLVLHGGLTNGVALRASLRTAAPLIGAGFDRIAHAAFVEGIEPADLAARARLRLDQLDSCASDSLVDLLEPSR